MSAVSPELQRAYDQIPQQQAESIQKCKITFIVLGIILVLGGTIAARVAQYKIGYYSYLVMIGGNLTGLPILFYGISAFLHPLKDIISKKNTPVHQAIQQAAPAYSGKRYELAKEYDRLSMFDHKKDIVRATLKAHEEAMVGKPMKGFLWEIRVGNARIHLIGSTLFSMIPKEKEVYPLVDPAMQAIVQGARKIYTDQDYVEAVSQTSHFGQLLDHAKDIEREGLLGTPDDAGGGALLHIIAALSKYNKKFLENEWEEEQRLEILDMVQTGNLETLNKMRDDAKGTIFGMNFTRGDITQEFTHSLLQKLKFNENAVIILNAYYCPGIISLLTGAERENLKPELKALFDELGAITVNRVAL